MYIKYHVLCMEKNKNKKYFMYKKLCFVHRKLVLCMEKKKYIYYFYLIFIIFIFFYPNYFFFIIIFYYPYP